MTKATKKKLDQLNATVTVLNAETGSKQKYIVFLAIGISALILIVAFIFIGKKRGR